MQNQNGSPPAPASSGSIDRPAERGWDHFVEFNNLTEKTAPDQLEFYKFVYYCAVMQTYNTMIEAIRLDPTMMLTVRLTAAMKADIDNFFQPPTVN